MGRFRTVSLSRVVAHRATAVRSTLQSLTHAHVQALQALLGDRHAVASPNEGDDTSAYATDWTKHYTYPSSSTTVTTATTADAATIPASTTAASTMASTTATTPSAAITVVAPSTVAHVAAVVSYCARHAIGLVPVAGRTGLVGGTVPLSSAKRTNTKHNESEIARHASEHALVLSTHRLNRIHGLDATTGILYCQAGCTLQQVQDYLASKTPTMEASAGNDRTTRPLTYHFPLDLAPRGTCCVGGVIATNAGGPYYTRYGSVAAHFVGSVAVTGTGDIVSLNYTSTHSDATHKRASNDTKDQRALNDTMFMPTSNLKDNTGYKLHQLLVGSEGTLAILTDVAIQCTPAPTSRHVAFLAVRHFGHVLHLVQSAQMHLGEILSAAEWMDGSAVDRVTRVLDLTNPLLDETTAHPYPHYLLVETHGTCADHDAAKLHNFVAAVMDGTTVQGIIASSEAQCATLWQLRESANPAAAQTGYTYKYDVSLPGSKFDDFIVDVQERVQAFVDATRNPADGDDPRVELISTNWGHVLDGNLHMNWTHVGHFDRHEGVSNVLEPYVYEAVLRRGGSISAEHGIGQAKTRYMEHIHSPVVLDLMRAVKRVFDPVGILNPGKVLPL